MNLYKPEKLRIGLKAYNSTLLDESCNSILHIVKKGETKTVGPIPLPTKYERDSIRHSITTCKSSLCKNFFMLPLLIDS